LLAFWSGLALAAHRYPSEYDWRYMTISSLLYADRNPEGFRWAWGGLMVCALGGLSWAAVWARALRQQHASARAAGIGTLAAGYLCMLACAMLPDRFLPVSRGHEMLAIAAFFAICIGIVRLTFRAALRSGWLGRSRLPGSSRIRAGLVAGAALLPMLLGGIVQLYVNSVRTDLPWVGLAWRARGVPIVLSFAFWEWTSCAVLTLYTALLAMAGSGAPQATRTGFR
jgi:hypothetical protein